MLKRSYLGSYFQSYLWKMLAMTFGLLSMVVVVPALSADKIVYGIYTVCISIGYFLSYADIGFYSAGLKYAAECVAKEERQEEYEILGFSSFILFVAILIITIFFLLLSINPGLLLNEIATDEGLHIASALLLIQAAFSFNYVLSRLIDGIFAIRIEAYIFQKYQTAGNILKMVSVFLFFSNGRYEIVSYFMLTKIVDVFVNLVGIHLIHVRYNYNLKEVFCSFKFDRQIYRKLKKLALASFVLTLLWISFYDIDAIAIGYLIGVDSVSIFSIALVLSNYYRTLLSFLYAPFQSRFNHFIGLNQSQKLTEFTTNLISLTAPVVLFSIVCIELFSEKIVLAWVGIEYAESIPVVRLLFMCYIFGFVSIPASYLLNCLADTKALYLIGFTSVMVFWAGIFATIDDLGVYSFALFKFISCTIAALVYLRSLLLLLKIQLMVFLKQTFYDLIIPLILIVVFFIPLNFFLPSSKGFVNLLIIASSFLSLMGVGFIALYTFSSKYKAYIRQCFMQILCYFYKARNRI